MITVYYDSGGSTQRISSQQKRKKKNSNFFFMHVKFVKSLFGGCQNDFNVTKGGYIGGGVLLGPQKVITLFIYNPLKIFASRWMIRTKEIQQKRTKRPRQWTWQVWISTKGIFASLTRSSLLTKKFRSILYETRSFDQSGVVSLTFVIRPRP